MRYDEISGNLPYSMKTDRKNECLSSRLKTLTKWHVDHCPEYKNIVESLWGGELAIDEADSYNQLPFLPVALFKTMDLCSVPKEEIVKTMTSSGTTGQQVSKIYLNRETAANQQKTLVKIVSDFTGQQRMPMLIIDSPSVIKNRAMFSARGAGILGFSIFGTKKMYALDDDMNLRIDEIKEFLEEQKGKTVLVFGFTYMIWKYFYKELQKTGEVLNLSDAVLIHGGGWKKMDGEAVSKQDFKQELNNVCNITRVHDYYGMVEQTGCIYMECECGHLHASIYSDVITRRMKDFSICEFLEEGVLQVVSALCESYPGHSILTEDTGIILGEDDCPCGRLGKYFEVTGRIKNAEVRGCSDTYDQRRN